MASSRKSSRSNPPLRPPLEKGGGRGRTCYAIQTSSLRPPLEKGGDRGGLAARVATQLEKIIKPSARLVVGLSGGVDSVVLLDCLRRAARKRRFRLSALHVDHQLSPNAGRWSAFCRRLCRSHGIPFESVKVAVARGDSLEAAARAARYAVFARQNCDYVVLAHHCDDQVETLLLQLLRGAGVKGLAAMPLLRGQVRGERREAQSRGRAVQGVSPPASRFPPPILRPLLDVTRAEILEYARKRRLKWIEDESNADVRFRRNYLRHEVLPAIARRFPAYRAAIARSARHIAEAHQVLDEVAAADGAGCLRDGALEVAGLRELPAARARNLLRYFIAGRGVAMPATGRLDEALRQMLVAKRDARVAVELEGAALRRFKGRIHLVRQASAPGDVSRRWRGEAQVPMPELGGMLTLARCVGSGVSLARLRGQPVTIGVRLGGERLQPDCRRPRRSLKNLLQEAGMPLWQRERLPLLFHGRALVWVPGIGVDCAYQAKSGEPALAPRWSASG